MNPSTKQKQIHREQTCGCQGGEDGGMNWEFRVGRCKLLCIEWINKVLLDSTGNSTQSPRINHHEKKYKKNVYNVYNKITSLYNRN